MTNRRDLMGLGLGVTAFGAAATMTLGEADARAAPSAGLDALARAKGMTGFGSCIGDGNADHQDQLFQ